MQTEQLSLKNNSKIMKIFENRISGDLCLEGNDLSREYQQSLKEPVPEYVRERCICALFGDGKYCSSFDHCTMIQVREVVHG